MCSGIGWPGTNPPLTSKETLTGNYRRSFRRMIATIQKKDKDGSVICDAKGKPVLEMPGAHPHMFRDTFAVEAWLAGWSIGLIPAFEDVRHIGAHWFRE